MSKRLARVTAGWVFGFAVTIFLISVWGRAIVVDTESLGDTLAPLSQTLTVTDQVESWLIDALGEEGVDRAEAAAALDGALESSVVDDVLEDLMVAVVEAAASPDPEFASVDVGDVLEPAIPELVFGIEAAGVDVSGEQIRLLVQNLDPLEVREPGTAPLVGRHSVAAARLGTATFLSLLVILVAGWVLVTSAEDRWTEARQLMTKVALSALSFGLLLRLGGWVLDPAGGRAPVSTVVAALANSKWMVPVALSLVAGLVAGATWLSGRYFRRKAGSSPLSEPPTREEELLPIR